MDLCLGLSHLIEYPAVAAWKTTNTKSIECVLSRCDKATRDPRVQHRGEDARRRIDATPAHVAVISHSKFFCLRFLIRASRSPRFHGRVEARPEGKRRRIRPSRAKHTRYDKDNRKAMGREEEEEETEEEEEMGEWL